MKGAKLLSFLKDSRVLVVVAVLAIIAGLIALNKTRENMTGKNPVITLADIQSIVSGKPSDNILTLRRWIAKNGPSAAKPGSPAETTFANSLVIYGTALPSLTTTPTVPEFAVSYAAVYNVNPISVANNSILNPPEILVDYASKDQSSTGIYTYYVFQYYFTDAAPPPPPAPPSSVPATVPATLAGATTPSVVSGSSIPLTGSPTPAASSATQPSPIGAGIPTPCHPSYQSIPGGSVEYRCFS